MSEGNGKKATTDTDDGTEAMVEPWMEYWMKLFEQNGDWMEALMAGKPPDVDPATIRKEWLGAMTKSVDGYLRTPAFLEAMRKNSETLTATKVTTELAKREVARQAGMPHIEDISGLYERLETAHEVVLDKLSAIERRLGAVEKSLAKTSTKKAKTKKATKSKKSTGGKK